jgi:hypothetical protein
VEYEYLMKKIFPLGNDYIMDKNPSDDVLLYPRSYLGDVSSIANNRFNSFQTNFILGDIPKESRINFFKKAFSVLTTGGRLAMIEMKKNIDFDQLDQLGFKKIKVEEAPFYNKRREMIDLLENKINPKSVICSEVVLLTVMK